MSQHTPTPWSAAKFNDTKATTLYSEVLQGRSLGNLRRAEDAEFVVRAVNSHEALLDIAKELREAIKRGGDLQLGPKGRNATLEEHVEKAIAQAEKDLEKK